MTMAACKYARPFVDKYEFFRPPNLDACDDNNPSQEPVVDRYASIGLGDVSEDFPLVEATMDKFRGSKKFLFYRTRENEAFVNNSTIWRTNIIESQPMSDLPESTIGYSMPNRTKWIEEYSSARFCLVLRGDTPNSHALLRSIRAGCVPCIVSDTYPIYNPALQSSLEMDDFAIFIPEQSFLRDPRAELLKLLHLPKDFIERKISGIRLAQRVLMPDHPQSLLIPALLREVVETNKDDYISNAIRRAKDLLSRNGIATM